MKYDNDRSGHLEGQEFFNAYCDLCREMGLNAPTDYNTMIAIAQKSDKNFDGKINKL